MDRKGIIAVSLAIAVLIGWTIWNSKEMAKVAAAQAKVKAPAAQGAGEPKPADPATPAPVPVETTPVAPAVAAEAEKREEIASPSVKYTFTNLGGGIASAQLQKHEAERGQRMTLNEFGSIPIGAVTDVAGEGAAAPFAMTVESGSVTFERTDSRQLQLTKKFTPPTSTDLAHDYVVTLDVTFTNRSPQPLALPGYFVHTGSTAPVHQRDQATYTGFMQTGGKFIDPTYFNAGWFRPERPVFTFAREGIAWAGVANQYFTTLVTPSFPTPEAAVPKARGHTVWAKRFVIPDAAWQTTGRSIEGGSGPRYGMDGALGMPPLTLEPGKSFTQSFRIFAGPREFERLRLMPEDQEEIMDFGIFGIVSKTLLKSMNWLKRMLGSYALAIIVLTLIIKSLLWPMQNKSTQSMKRMQLLQPKMTELREKYKDDPTRMNTEVMKLYKDYGVNPLSGCLPMVVQIPIFFGFFSMLGKAVELRNSKFLWVHDLSLPDTIFHLPSVGWPVNILPLVMAATMLWQMAISPKSGDPMQQRMMMFMPLIFIAFCYNYASALALYWTVQNLFSVAQLYATRNQAAPTLQKVAAPPKRK
ncbi:MAG: membrane protein insertase YidC [Chthoniobacter sp.]|nr:membrane protein insertase YidC [Chthoniobacter sp.]